MEGKKKFEKPEMKVVEMKLRPLAAGSECQTDGSCTPYVCDLDCDRNRE